MKLNNVLLEADPVGDVKKDIGRQMKRVLGPHKDLKQMERALKGALTLNPAGTFNNAVAVAVAHKIILDVLFQAMKDQQGVDGSVERAFEEAAVILENGSWDFQRNLNPSTVKQANRIIEKEVSDVARELNRR